MSICNIYAPNVLVGQQKFAQTLKESLMSKSSLSNLIIGGDWNATLQTIDKKRGYSVEADCIPPSNYFDDERIDLTDVVRKKKYK